MKDSGFINYFGMQRFGKFHDTHDVGIAVLKGDFEQACEIILRVKENENHRCIAPREKWAKRFDGINMEDDKAVQIAEMQCAKVVQRELGRFMNCETSIVSSLARNPRDYKKAFGSIAKHMRSMFLHAYQSYIWNKAASHRITDGGSNEIRVGDLVLVEDKGLADGGNGTSGLKGKAVKEVTQDDVETCKYSITDVVLPLAGSKIEYPTDSTGDVYDDLLAEAGLGKEDFDKIGDRELAVGGDYRKIICKPSDVNFEIKLYTDPVQPIVKTDLMDVHNASLECVDVTDEVKKDETTINTEEKMIIGMVVGFTLPPSAYATIALREMTRRPTSSQYQTELSLEGDCEANLGKAKTESSYYGAS
jgi:tRNA pseudouridine13 synthase